MGVLQIYQEFFSSEILTKTTGIGTETLNNKVNKPQKE
jgi:hypothetical protein